MKYSTFPAKWLLWTACITLVLASCNIEINLPASASSDSQPGNSYSSAAEREQQDNAPSSSSESSQPASSEVRVDFWADDTNLNAGECTVLHWNTSGGTAYINGGQHPPSGEYEICPEKTTKYKLELENPPNNLLDKEEFTVQVNQTNGVNTPAPTNDDPVVVAPQDPSPADIQPEQPQQPSKLPEADIDLTDIYPGKQPYGQFHVRVTNNGPDTLNKVPVTIACFSERSDRNVGDGNWVRDNDTHIDLKLSIKPGETQSFPTGLTLDTTVYNYYVECEPYSNGSYKDPVGGNNLHAESLIIEPEPQPTLE